MHPFLGVHYAIFFRDSYRTGNIFLSLWSVNRNVIFTAAAVQR